MTDYSFPLRNASEFAERLTSAPADVPLRRWVLRDDNEQHYHARVRLDEDPLYLELRWKPDARGKEQLVGVYRLHLHRLVDAGYARRETDDPSNDEIRLRVYRGSRGVVYIQTRLEEPALPIGVIDVTLG
jgi:hypothetical protein